MKILKVLRLCKGMILSTTHLSLAYNTINS